MAADLQVRDLRSQVDHQLEALLSTLRQGGNPPATRLMAKSAIENLETAKRLLSNLPNQKVSQLGPEDRARFDRADEIVSSLRQDMGRILAFPE